jgi:hypothetical protein
MIMGGEHDALFPYLSLIYFLAFIPALILFSRR